MNFGSWTSYDTSADTSPLPSRATPHRRGGPSEFKIAQVAMGRTTRPFQNLLGWSIVGELGSTGDELCHTGHQDRNFYTCCSMGLRSSIAFGMALSTEERVIALDGDGSLLIRVVVVWDNEDRRQTGYQPSQTATGTYLAEIVARTMGYAAPPR